MCSTFTATMEDFQSLTEPRDEALSNQRIYRDFGHKYGRSGFHQRLSAGRCSGFPCHRLVTLSLGLLNAVLLVTGIVLGVYCVKASYFQVPVSDATPLLLEMKYLRNQSGLIKATLEAKAALAKELAGQTQLKLQLKQHRISIDRIQRQIVTLRTERESLLSNKSVLEENCGRCPPAWNLLKSSCYYFSVRHESNSKKDWFASRADCQSRGAELLVINNLEEQQLLSALLPSQSGSGEWWEKGYWIGLTDVVTDGTWVWVNNVTEVERIYWRNGQPKSSGPQSGDCAALFYFHDTTKMWYNGNCHNHRFNWICEKQPSSI